MNTYEKEAFDRDNSIIAPLGFALFALINIPFIDASGIVIRLCEIFMVDNGVGTVSRKLFSSIRTQKFESQICSYVHFETTGHAIGRAYSGRFISANCAIVFILLIAS